MPVAWKSYPFRAEPPRIGHHREFPSPRGGGGAISKYITALLKTDLFLAFFSREIN